MLSCRACAYERRLTSFRTESQHAHANANNTGKAASMHAEVPKRIFPLALLPEAQQTSVAELDLRLTTTRVVHVLVRTVHVLSTEQV